MVIIGALGSRAHICACVSWLVGLGRGAFELCAFIVAELGRWLV